MCMLHCMTPALYRLCRARERERVRRKNVDAVYLEDGNTIGDGFRGLLHAMPARRLCGVLGVCCTPGSNVSSDRSVTFALSAVERNRQRASAVKLFRPVPMASTHHPR